MPVHVELEFAAGTDPGRVRARNEDAVALSPEWGFAILADGMGGYNAGEVASGIAVDTLKKEFERHLAGFDWTARVSRNRRLQGMFITAVIEANAAILDAGRADPRLSGMGTTIVAAFFHHDKVLVAHVGDSRLYRWRDGELALLTRDHSLLQEQVDAGLIDAEQARLSPHRNLITRALGIDARVDVELQQYPTLAGDVYLLCSDGLSDMLPNSEIASLLASGAGDLGTSCAALIDHANGRGGNDNISVVMIRIRSHAAGPDHLIERMMKWMR